MEQGCVFGTKENKNWPVTEKVLLQTNRPNNNFDRGWRKSWEMIYYCSLVEWKQEWDKKVWKQPLFILSTIPCKRKQLTQFDRPFVWDTQTKSNYTQGSKLWSTSAIESATKVLLTHHTTPLKPQLQIFMKPYKRLRTTIICLVAISKTTLTHLYSFTLFLSSLFSSTLFIF